MYRIEVVEEGGDKVYRVKASLSHSVYWRCGLCTV